jgi:hypothetical protein
MSTGNVGDRIDIVDEEHPGPAYLEDAGDVVAEDQAQADFDRFAEAWLLDTDVDTMPEEDAQSFETLERKLLRAIREGVLSVSGDGVELEYKIRFPLTNGADVLTIRPPTGAALMSFDRLKDRQNIAKLNAYMGSMCKTAPQVFARMDGRDLKIIQAVATIFLAS